MSKRRRARACARARARGDGVTVPLRGAVRCWEGCGQTRPTNRPTPAEAGLTARPRAAAGGAGGELDRRPRRGALRGGFLAGRPGGGAGAAAGKRLGHGRPPHRPARSHGERIGVSPSGTQDGGGGRVGGPGPDSARTRAQDRAGTRGYYRRAPRRYGAGGERDCRRPRKRYKQDNLKKKKKSLAALMKIPHGGRTWLANAEKDVAYDQELMVMKEKVQAALKALAKNKEHQLKCFNTWMQHWKSSLVYAKKFG
ncbi:translation initiation factor IF-2-like [Elephas maximus indicus]|uniref:translation initiation factor IF-2-like n=1 Tax=Elephas maximus indicus TaxID=99487 RepID=UPI00211695E7|nr:translation initiation factor IF-2-like [Elephas maximus indicus]